MAAALLLRTGVARDLKSIAAIEKLAAQTPWTLSQFLNASLQTSSTFLVAEDGDENLQGFAVFQTVLDEATVLNVAVHPNVQRQGVGRALMQALVQRAHSNGVRRILLEVRASNAAAIRLYRSEGFVDDGIRKSYYPAAGGREDAQLMSLELAAEQ
ncbi:MAG: ribosomal protein S18-alanine N-acetyltransferase [Pseudomonadota bacterium]